jgi:hypothetical protein
MILLTIPIECFSNNLENPYFLENLTIFMPCSDIQYSYTNEIFGIWEKPVNQND